MEVLSPDIFKIEIIKFVVLPTAGFLSGLVLFFWIVKKDKIDHKRGGVIFSLWLVVVVAALTFTTLLSLLNFFKYHSFHTLLLDHGAYERKIWEISQATSILKMFEESSWGHLQPLLLLYGILYKIVGSGLLLYSQVIIVVSGIIPLYLFAKEKLRDDRLTAVLLLVYLLYPPVSFNAMVDFHPDHLYIPFALWAYYFVQKKRHVLALLTIGVGAMAKEPLLLGAAFFGLYLVFEKKDYRLGFSSFFVFMFLFYLTVFIVLPALAPEPRGENVLEFAGFGLWAITEWKVRKLLFLYFIFVPFLFLPVWGWRALIPAIPFIGIPLLSHTYLHSSIHSQYTAGIIPPIFASVVCGLSKIEKGDWKKYAFPSAVFVLIMIATFHVAHSPTPFSLAFWFKGASIKWDKSNYVYGEHEKKLKEAIFLIPDDSKTKVVYQNDINYARLSNRNNFAIFPVEMDVADYILVDNSRHPFVGDKLDREEYNNHVTKLTADSRFKIIYNEDGVKLFSRVKSDEIIQSF